MKPADTEAPEGYEEFDPSTATDPQKEKYYQRVRKDFQWDLNAHDSYIKDFDAYESMLLSKPYDTISKKSQSTLSDGRTTTIYLERAARVVGKLPDGQMKAAGKKDTAAGAVLEILRTKWVFPNANSQKKLLKKIRLWQFNASVYGFMPMYYDWNVNEKTGYVGPDCWLWHPRNFIPQLGRSSIDDMDYAHSITYVSEDYLEDLLEEDKDAGWDQDEIKKLIEMVREKTTMPASPRQSLVTRQRQTQAERGRIMLATRYEAGDDGNWVVFAPEYNGIVLRMIRNPHKNGKIPFVIKYATDLFDNFYGLGDFQRAKPLQFANDGLDNFYFAGIKRGLYQPTIINPAGVVKSSITNDPGAVWQETIPNSIREYKTDPVGLSTYQNAKTIMNGALLSQSGTTDTSLNAAGTNDPSFSKTDAGVTTQNEKESTRDAQDRFELETALEELIDAMMGLIPTIGTEKIPVDLFYEDIEELIDQGYGDDLAWLKDAGHLDVSDSGTSAKLTVPPDFFRDMDCRFHMTYSSTAKEEKQSQLQSLKDFLQEMTSMQNELVEMKNQGMTIDWALIAKLFGSLGDVPQMEKIFRQMTPQEMQQWQQSQAQANQPPAPPHPATKIIESMGYKDMPDDIKRQMEAMVGFNPSQDGTTTDQKLKIADTAAKIHGGIMNHATSVASAQQQADQATAQQQAAAPQAPTAELPPIALAQHGGTPIADPDLAMAHANIGRLIQNEQPQR